MTRPLEPLTLGSNDYPTSTDTLSFVFEKTGRKTQPMRTLNNGFANYLLWSPTEVRQIHTWLGQLIEDLDQGV